MKKLTFILALSIMLTGCASTRDYTVNGQHLSDRQVDKEKVLTVVKTVGLAAVAVAIAGAAGGKGKVCHVGPQGGTYTITSGGNKNYAGC